MLWPEAAPSEGEAAGGEEDTIPRDGETVRQELEGLIARQIEETPKRGKGARRWRFARHVARVFKSYAPGLFHCYDRAEIPQTTNELEGKNGTIKHHVRKTTGKRSTTGGPAESMGEVLADAIDTVKRRGFKALAKRCANVCRPAYKAARDRVRTLREPARRYRSIQRNPQRHLNEILEQWEVANV